MGENRSNASSNDSCSLGSPQPHSEPTQQLQTIFISIAVIVTVICISANFLLIRAFCKFSNLRTASNMILVSLCIADCFIAMTFILEIIRLALEKGDNNELKCILCQINASLFMYNHSHCSSSRFDQRRACHCCEVPSAVQLYPDQSSSVTGFRCAVGVDCVSRCSDSPSSEFRKKLCFHGKHKTWPTSMLSSTCF